MILTSSFRIRSIISSDTYVSRIVSCNMTYRKKTSYDTSKRSISLRNISIRVFKIRDDIVKMTVYRDEIRYKHIVLTTRISAISNSSQINITRIFYLIDRYRYHIFLLYLPVGIDIFLYRRSDQYTTNYIINIKFVGKFDLVDQFDIMNVVGFNKKKDSIVSSRSRSLVSPIFKKYI